MLDLLPEEIQRKIIVMCEKTNAVRNISITSKQFHNLGIQKHFVPKALEYYYSLDDNECKDRSSIYKSQKRSVQRVCTQINTPPFVYSCIDLIDNLSEITGDHSVYDTTYHYYRINKTKYEYKTLGFMNLCEFDHCCNNKNDKLTNIWKNTKWCFVRQYFQNASLTLKALI